MAAYYTCPRCGCNLDHGEKCDCEKEKAVAQQEAPQQDSGERAEESPSQLTL